MLIALFLTTVILLVVFGGLFINRKAILAEKNKLDVHCNNIQHELNRARELNAEYRGKLDSIDEYRSHIIELKQDNEELRDINLKLQNQLTRIETRETALLQKEQSFKEEFDNIARKILEDNTKKLSESSSAKLNDVLSPFREKLNEFHKKVDDVYVKEEKERYSLKAEIEKLAKTHENLHSQAENLAKALKGDNKTQGNWGEIQLLRILEDSGLVQNQDYVIQGKGIGLENDLGGRQQPDVIIKLPEDKHIIIDSKVNLVFYERYSSSDVKEEQAEHLKAFINSIKEQVKKLREKNYQSNEKLGSPDFALMFMPIESAYTVAILEDATLHNFAWERKIILCSPSVLFAMLKTIAYGISNDKKNKNIENILNQSASMYDNFVAFVEDMQKIDTFLHKSQESYDNALHRLTTGRGNLISKAEKIREMGIKVKRPLPASLTNELEEALTISENKQIEEEDLFSKE